MQGKSGNQNPLRRLSQTKWGRLQDVKGAHVFEVPDEDARLQLQHGEQLPNGFAEVISLLAGQALPVCQEHHLQLLHIVLDVLHVIWYVQPAAW